MSAAEFQLEFWIAKGRKGAWVPIAQAPVGNYRTWRKVKPDHDHADKLAHSIAKVRAAHRYTRAEMCKLYCDWALARHRVSVTTYRDDGMSNHYANVAGLNRVQVDPGEFIGPAPAAAEDTTH